MLLKGIDSAHLPVMVPEVLEYLMVQEGGRYLDATCGEGGHARAILNASSPSGQLLGLDADRESLMVAERRMEEFGKRFFTENTNFRKVRAIALEKDFIPLHGVLFDLGVSSLQLEEEPRGFSFKRPEPLDMRFSISQKLTAADIINEFDEEEIADIIYQFGEERAARRIARAIVRNRPISNSLELSEIVEKASSKRGGYRIHPSTKTFQALRIAVNDELTALETALEQATSLLGQSGRLVVISYHSLEDRIVKSFIKREMSNCYCPAGTSVCRCGHSATLKRVTPRPLTPTPAELKANRRSRSAKLRVAERV